MLGVKKRLRTWDFVSMNIAHVVPPQAKEWGRSPKACEILNMGKSRLGEIMLELPKEDPEGIIETFVLKSPGSQRGTRLFELNSLRRWLNWKYQQAQAADRERLETRQAKAQERALEAQKHT
jgi:hypothetical protein